MCVCVCVRERERERERKKQTQPLKRTSKNRHTDRQTLNQRDRQTDGKFVFTISVQPLSFAAGQKDKQTEGQIEGLVTIHEIVINLICN